MEDKDWAIAMQPLLDKYSTARDPLYAESLYQVLVKVVLAAQDSDAHINKLAPALFKDFPNMKALYKANSEQLKTHLSSVRFHANKIAWLQDIASVVKDDKNIPTTMKGLVALKGVGRKSANVIMRAAGAEPEGIMVDLHVVRVSQRIGIAHSADATKIEKEMMAKLPKEMWGEIGSAISHLGREICRPTNPKHELCPVSTICEYCHAKQAGIEK